MYFKRKSIIMFRDYTEFGYITDNRNYGYKRKDDNRKDIGDKILSESGTVFFSALGNKATHIDEIIKIIKLHYSEIDTKTIKKDVEDFFSLLQEEGFISSGLTQNECELDDKTFSYTEIFEGNEGKNKSTNKALEIKSSQDFFTEYFNGKPQLSSIHIELTSECNERCLHCYIPHEYKISKIEPDLFYQILDQCNDMKLLHLTLSGGEPMLHEYFCDFLKKCREYNFSINILSNLTLLNNHILEELKANALLGVQVSLYSMDDKIHDEITQIKGSFKKTMDSMLKLIENNIPIKISCPILKQNKDSYMDVIDWANKYKIQVGNDYVILAQYNNNTQNLDHRLSIDDVQRFIENASKSDPSYIHELKLEAEKKKDICANDYVCSVCSSSLCIADNGNVHPCAGWQNFVVGNIKETTIKDVWYDSKKVNYLRDLRKKSFPECLVCPDKEYCTMCMVRNYNEDPNGNHLTVNKFFCKIANINKSLVQNNTI